MLAAPIFLQLSRSRRLECDIWLVHLTGEEFPADCMGARHLAQSMVEGSLKLRVTGRKPVDLSKAQVDSAGLKLDSTDVTDATKAGTAITAIDTALASLGTMQGTVGTGQNKLQYGIQLAQSQITSYSAAQSRIRDADVAAEAANLTKAQVLQQASLAAMAQANSAPQAVLALLRG